MTRNLALAFVLALLAASAAFGQQTVTDIGALPPRFGVAAGYSFIRANSPPGSCECFSASGGFAAADWTLSHWLSVTGLFTATHSSKISSLGQGLTLTTFMGGPKVAWVHFRFTPFAYFLLGGAHGGDSWFPAGSTSTTSASSFAYSPGVGFDMHITPRIELRPIDAQYLHTAFPNGSDNSQNHIQIAAGVVVRFNSFGPRFLRSSSPPRPAPPAPEVNFNCNAADREVVAGTAVQIVGQALLLPDRGSLTYTWSTSGGAIQGEGRIITVETANLEPGTYSVEGRAALQSNPSVAASCEATFQVKAAAPPQVQQSAASASPDERNRDFREHVRDVFFDYDKADLRSDAQQALAQDAAYLVAHPDVNITIAGYSDERGSMDFNVALGLQRATATRDALAAAGVPIDRMQILSYGKQKPFCDENTEVCYQLNRRAQILLDSR